MDAALTSKGHVLVTGARGYVGRAVVSELAADGYEPRELLGDIRSGASLADAVRGVVGVVHLAGVARVRDAGVTELESVNAGGTATLLSVLSAAGSRVPVVLASSAAVYGSSGGRLSEASAVAPVNAYGRSKLLAEHHLAAYEGPTVALRCFNVAGALPGMPDADGTRIVNRALAVARGSLDSLTINGDGTARRDYVHVADVAAAYRLALESSLSGLHAEKRCYVVGSGVGVSLTEIVAAVEATTGRPVPVTYGPAGDEAAELVADPALAAHDLDWEPHRSQLGRIIHDAWTATSAT
ncbi:NAD-dependent epimerase/dehydratase family protein [Spongisporangium articulatum]|uniref:UDP-glucose 4-epimerase n=1 Tax=Spongisporangium articulatum TaxID=3362603 RepID=A0ABW8AJE8_9ACTN